MADFLAVQVVGVEYAEFLFGRMVAELPEMTIQMPREVGGSVMEQVVIPAMEMQSPYKTGALRGGINWRIAESNADETTVEVFSDAANTSTGYLYAKARAYGFNVRGKNSYFWEPPEDPPFPVAAMEQAQSFMEMVVSGDALRKTIAMVRG